MQSKSVRFKIFLWDQFIRPVYTLFDLDFIKTLLTALIVILLIIGSPIDYVIITAVGLFILSLVGLIRYYKSGDFVANYRKYKYPKYKKATKVFKKESRLNDYKETPESINYPGGLDEKEE